MGLYTDLLSSFICDKSIQEWAKWDLWKTAFKKFKWYDLFKNTLSQMFGDRSLILSHTPNLQWFVRTFSLAGHHCSDYLTISDPDVEVLIYSEVVFSTLSLPLYYMMFCAIRYHLYNLKNVKNTLGGVLLLVKEKVTLLRGSLPCFLNFTNGTKLRNALHISFLLTN